MASSLRSAHPHSATHEELESKVQHLLREELCGLDTAAMVLAAAGYPMEAGYDGGEQEDEASGLPQDNTINGNETWL